MDDRRVVVTGLGVASPFGMGIDAFWDGLMSSRCAVGRISAFDASSFACQIAGEVSDLNVRDFISKKYRKAAKVMARDIELAIGAAYHAVKDAGLVTKCLVEREESDRLNVDSSRLGCNIGAGLICADLPELAQALSTAVEDERAWPREFSLKKWGGEGMQRLTPLWLLKFLPNMLACHVTIVHDAQGPSNTITCAEASSHLAIGEAYRTIARGTLDVCLCGGAESKLNPMGLVRQELLGRLTGTHNDDPAGACRPFDRNRDGTVISEGAGILAIEALDHARGRGATIHAEVVGFGAANSAAAPGKPEPTGRGIALAIRKALGDAGMAPADVQLVCAFGAGTADDDQTEANGIRAALGDPGHDVPVLAIKSGLGNNGAGSGALDLIAGIKAMSEGVIPATANCTDPDPACGLKVVAAAPLRQSADVLLATSYAMHGGQCAALVIKKVDSEEQA